MKIEYDREVDALYVRLQEKFVAKTVEVDEGINIDFDDDGRLIGLEILDATERYALLDIFNISTENVFPENVRTRQAPPAPCSPLCALSLQNSMNSINLTEEF